LVKRGLIICYYFPPSGGGGVQRWVKFVKYLSRLGWELTVISAPTESGTPVDKSLLQEIPETTRILCTPIPAISGGIFFQLKKFVSRGYWQRWLRALFFITDSRKAWNKTAFRLVRRELEARRYDVIIVSSPPYSLSMLAAELKSQTAVPVVLDLRDPWTTNPYKIYPTGFHLLLDRRRENACITKIENLISVYGETFDHFNSTITNFNLKHLDIIPNGYDDEDFATLPEFPEPDRENYHLAFSGTFYSHLNRPDLLFSAIGRLKKEGCRIMFHHFGQSMIDLEYLAEKHGVAGQFQCWGYLEHRELLARLMKMNAFCVILDPRVPNAENTAGGKLYEYLWFKKPIFALVPENGAAARILSETDSGIAIDSTDPERVADQLKRLMNNEYSFRFRNTDVYSRKNLAARLDRFLTEKIQPDRK
jgi:glycosyltransferase involved in cell wall biosynthesis